MINVCPLGQKFSKKLISLSIEPFIKAFNKSDISKEINKHGETEFMSSE